MQSSVIIYYCIVNSCFINLLSKNVGFLYSGHVFLSQTFCYTEMYFPIWWQPILFHRAPKWFIPRIRRNGWRFRLKIKTESNLIFTALPTWPFRCYLQIWRLWKVIWHLMIGFSWHRGRCCALPENWKWPKQWIFIVYVTFNHPPVVHNERESVVALANLPAPRFSLQKLHNSCCLPNTCPGTRVITVECDQAEHEREANNLGVGSKLCPGKSGTLARTILDNG